MVSLYGFPTIPGPHHALEPHPPPVGQGPGYIHNALVEIRLLLLLGCFELRLCRGHPWTEGLTDHVKRSKMVRRFNTFT